MGGVSEGPETSEQLYEQLEKARMQKDKELNEKEE